ncbi:uncharacterized protein LOC101743057 isoform X2 [Bombyx mori]|uniref:Uncharacterized protein n=1 Tax=Bombyx mori TaxID=7091 RepID=A0A8R2M2Z0_BOMMO|nr:uncharacterized protein LOC101743057 isoform X2 [Bombyx mori]
MMSGDRATRPNSLVLDTPAPEREPLRFDVQLVGAPPEVEQLVNNIKQVAEEFLYHWKTFPIVLPPTRFGPGNRPCDIIIPPPCDEVDAAALDAGPEPQPLSPKQLQSIREKGEFEVPSRHFPGQTHVWRVAGWLQRGKVRAQEELYRHVARALALIVVVARDRLVKDEPLSVRAGIKSLLAGLHRLLDLAIGMPSMEARDLDKKIREERSRYLVAELICKPEQQEDVTALAGWVWRALRRAAAEKCAPRCPPPVPTLYTTPQHTQVDLRLYRREVMRSALGPLQAVLEREARGWFLHFREQQAAHLAREKMPLKDIEEAVRECGMREYVSRVCGAVRASDALRALGPGLPELLVAQLRAHLALHRAEEGVRKKIEAGLAAAEARVRASHPILSRADSWRNEKLAAAARRLRDECRWTALEDAAAAMQAHKLHQHRYFLLRDLAFQRDREPLLMKELRAARTARRSWQWARRVWRPARWAVVRHCRGRAERVRTAVAARAPAAPPRARPPAAPPVFLLRRDAVSTTSTRWPAWRLLNLAYRIWCWSWNLVYVLGVVVPWCSPLSLRALVCVKPYTPELEVSQVNGVLYPKKSSETHTMCSRLLALWRHVSKQRTKFETEPDTGLLGKGLSRWAHRVWWYGVVGGGGSAALLVVFPVCALAVSAAAVLLALAAPLWTPPLALAAHVAHAVLYDADSPDPALNRWCPLLEVVLWRVAVLGVLQPAAALLTALLLCPLAAAVLLVGGVAWWGARGVWESVAWRGVAARRARVPAHDSAFCRRVRGPGLYARVYYQLTCTQAAAAVCARAELETLGRWAADTERAIERPLRDFEHFVDACFGPFSVQIAKRGAYRQLERECGSLAGSLRDKVAARRRELALPLSDAARARARLSPRDLRRAIEASAAELSALWRREAREESWWAQRGLAPDDWHGLAANMLVEVFDAETVVALQDGEARLPLEGSEGAPPPDVLPHHDHDQPADCPYVWCSWGSGPALRVSAPALEPAAFSPRAALHPPLPHPATVALVLHNRDSDNPVPLDSELCAEILKSLEDAPDCDEKRDEVERYRGGGSSEGSSSEASAEEEERPREEDDGLCRVSGRSTCRWTLSGRGVRLRADLASPEDVSLDERPPPGTPV